MKIAVPAFVVFLAVAIPAASVISGEDAEPSFEELLRLNSTALFGGETKIENDRITIAYKKGGQFDRGFQGAGIVNPDSLKEANKNILGDTKEVAVVGRGDGEWTSRFDLSGDIALKFKIRMPGIQKGSQFILRINQSQKSQIQTSFFQDVALVQGGKPKKRTSAPKEFQSPPEKWLDRKALMDVNMNLHEGKLLLKVSEDPEKAKEREKEREKNREKSKEKGKDKPKDAAKDSPKNLEITLDEASEASGGKVSFSFRKLSFVVSDMTLSGKYDRAWCEEQLKQLDKDKKLVRKAEKPPPSPADLPPRKVPKTEGDEQAEKKKEAEEDL
jgi:hypothetical protein